MSAVPFHLRGRGSAQARGSQRAEPLVVPTWPLDEQALVRLPDGAIVTVAAAKIGLETFQICEYLIARYGDGV